MIQLGSVGAEIVSGGTLKLDGGNMFGPVPRVLWERKATPDARHRISMDTNCVLISHAGHKILIDTGYGGKADEKRRDFQGLEAGEPLLRNLNALGVTPTDITMVILTHLHFDHVGGCTRRNPGGNLEVVFPRAKHIVQASEWEDATAQLPELAGSYFEEDLLPLQSAGLVELVEGDVEILPDIRVRRVGGHTRGMQVVELGRQENGRPAGVCLADLAPTVNHLKAFWSMSYDQYPLDVRRTKPVVIGEVADNQSLILFSHDPGTRTARIHRDPRQEFLVSE